VQLFWPYSYYGYSLDTATKMNGPWAPSDATPFQRDGQNRLVVPAANEQQFFRLQKR